MDLDLSDDEKRALVVARELDAIDNATYRSVNGCDTLTASQHLRRLRNYDLLEMRGKGAKTYYKPTPYMLNPRIIEPPMLTTETDPKTSLSGGHPSLSGGSPPLSGGLSGKVGGSEHSPDISGDLEIPDELLARMPPLKRRLGRDQMRLVILELCAWRPLMPSELADYLGRKSTKRLVEDYVSPLFAEGLLERTIPDKPAHPAQKYKTTEEGLKILFVSGSGS